MSQQALRLPPAPRPQTVELLFRALGDVIVPVDQVRHRYFPALNADNFTRALASGRIGLPVVLLDTSNRATKFIDIRHLAILIDAQADAADDAMTDTQETHHN